MQIEISRVKFSDLETTQPEEPSASIKERVEQARAIQRQRFTRSKASCNAQMSPHLVRKHCKTTPEAHSLLREAFKKLHLSARSHDKILKVSRTIADLAGSKIIEVEHMGEALQYRSITNLWG